MGGEIAQFIEWRYYEELEWKLLEFDKHSQLVPGTEQHKAAADTVVKFMDRAIEMEKVNNDCDDKTEIRENDRAMKQQQLDDEKKDRLIKNIISGAGIALPLIVTIWGTKVSLKFEETGSFTTIMGRGFINKLLPKK